ERHLRARRQLRDMRGEPFERHRFLVRLVTTVGRIQRYALEELASALHLIVIVECDRPAGCHENSIPGIADSFSPPSMPHWMHARNIRPASSAPLAVSRA